MDYSGDFRSLLDKAVSFHGHVCGGQPLGVRMAMAGLRELGMTNPSETDNLVVFVEIDRCIADAIQIVTGCTLGRRRLKLINHDKFAATFLDISNGKAVRISSKKDARAMAMKYAGTKGWIMPGERLEEFSEREKMIIIKAYSEMPEADLISIEKVRVNLPEEEAPGPAMHVVTCDSCGELIFDHKEIARESRVLCGSCASGPYYEK